MLRRFLTRGGGGDILLVPEKKSRKKLLLISFSVIVVAAIIIAVVISTLNQTEPLELSFNKLANYVLFGSDSSDEIELESIDNVSVVLREKFNEEDHKYIEGFKKQLNNFKSNYEKEKNSLDNYMITQIESYLRTADFLIDIANFVNYDDELVLGLFNDGGATKVKNEFGNNYKPQESDSDDFKEFMELQKEYTEEYLLILEYYNSTECTEMDIIGVSCALNDSFEKFIDEKYEKLDILKNEISSIKRYAFDKIVYDIPAIIENINNWSNNE